MIEILPTNTCPPDARELVLHSEAFSKFAPHIQLDIADGIFVPTLSWPYKAGQWLELEHLARKKNALPFSDALFYEAHLMVDTPEVVGELLARAGCRRILAHVEVFADDDSVRNAFSRWKKAGASEVGLVLLIDTPLSILDHLVSECDAVQLMSIAVLGAQGAAFDSRVISRIAELHARYPKLLIAIDGGVSEKNIAELVQAGARRFGVGSAISKSADPAEAYKHIQELAESALY